jgi:hypothetical protein
MNKPAITYSINTIDSESEPRWMRYCEQVTPGPQDSGRCHYTAVTRDPAKLEAALERDPKVLKYSVL